MRESRIQPSVHGQPASHIRAKPVRGCTRTAVAVNKKSAITTVSATCATSRESCVRCAITMKKAMPAPVPNSTVAPITCSQRSASTSMSALLGGRGGEGNNHEAEQNLEEGAEWIEPEVR